MSAGDEHPAAVPSVLVHVPHASRAIPPDVRAGIELADDDLERELDRMTDSFTDRIAAQAAELARAAVGVLAAPQSRLVVDVERFPDEREAMNAVGMGAVYTRTHDGRVLRREFDPGLLDRCFHPHAAAVTREVERMLEHHGRAVLVDLHSYPTVRLPYELAGPGDPRPQVCLARTPSTHRRGSGTPPPRRSPGSTWPSTRPSPGTYVPLRHYGTDARVASVMIELRRQVYMDETEVRPLPGIEDVATRLARLLDTVAAHRERTSPPRRPAMPVPSGA